MWVYRPRPGCLSLWSFYCLPIDGVLSQSPFVVEITSSTESSHFLALMSATKCYSGVTKRFRSQKANQSNSKCHCFFFFFFFFFFFLRNLQPKESQGSLIHGFYKSEVGHTVSHTWVAVAFTFPEEKYSC